jgi:hypothetical protein
MLTEEGVDWVEKAPLSSTRLFVLISVDRISWAFSSGWHVYIYRSLSSHVLHTETLFRERRAGLLYASTTPLDEPHIGAVAAAAAADIQSSIAQFPQHKMRDKW